MRVLNRFLELPIIYATWQAPFARQKFLPVERAIKSKMIRRALDVGCGPWTTALALAAARPDAAVLGCDLSEPLVAIARQRAAGVPNLRFVVDDAERSDARRREVERGRGSEPAGPDQQDPGLEQLLLPGQPDLRDQKVARVALALLGR